MIKSKSNMLSIFVMLMAMFVFFHCSPAEAYAADLDIVVEYTAPDAAENATAPAPVVQPMAQTAGNKLNATDITSSSLEINDNTHGGAKIDYNKYKKELFSECIEKALASSVRISDTIVKCSNVEYYVVLVNCDSQNSDIFIERMMGKLNQYFKNPSDFKIDIDKKVIYDNGLMR